MTPQEYAEQAHQGRYSLELVAKIAVAILTSKSSDSLEPAALRSAAELAVDLLDACQKRLQDESLVYESRHLAAEAKDAAFLRIKEKEYQLECRYPKGIPWLKGLLYITGKRSETEALPSFKEWRSFQRARERMVTVSSAIEDKAVAVAPSATEKKDVEEEVKRLRLDGFTSEVAVQSRSEFKAWYTQHGIPAKRSNAAKMRRAEKKLGPHQTAPK